MRNGVAIALGENYVKQSYRNRFDILGVNGRMALTVPVQGQKGEKVNVRDIKIADDSWRRSHLISLRSAYGRAACFEYYFDELEKIILHRQQFLVDLNLEALDFISRAGLLLNLEPNDEPVPNSLTQHFEPSYEWPELPSYPQVFGDRFPFVSNLSVIDLLMNLGPKAGLYMATIKVNY